MDFLPYFYKTLKDHDYGCLMAVLPDETLRQSIVNFVLDIPDFHLGTDGQELRPHITVKYGFTDSSPETIQQLKSMLARIGAIEVELGDLSLFQGVDDQDVLKIDIHSPMLHMLHEAVSTDFPNADKHPIYKPHLTLAYLRPEVSESYLKNNPFKGQRITFNQLEWSGADGRRETIPLSYLSIFRQKDLANSQEDRIISNGSESITNYEGKSHAGSNGTADRTNSGTSERAPGTGQDDWGRGSNDEQRTESTDAADGLRGGNRSGRMKTLSYLNETAGGALVPPAEQKKRRMRTIVLTDSKAYPTPPSTDESYFASCERDKGGQCLPKGQSGHQKGPDEAKDKNQDRPVQNQAVASPEPGIENPNAMPEYPGMVIADANDTGPVPGIQPVNPPKQINDADNYGVSPKMVEITGGIKKPQVDFKTQDITEINEAIDAVFGKKFDRSILGAMACGLDDQNVELSKREGRIQPRVVTTYVDSHISDPENGYEASRAFYRNSEGDLIAVNESFMIDKNSKYRGRGAEIFANQVMALQKADVAEILTTAGGYGPNSGHPMKSDMNGYYTWPLLGYEADIPDKAFKRLPPLLQEQMGESRSIQDLFDLENGPQAWEEYGSALNHAHFDLAPGSRSMKRLESYMEQRKNETPEQKEARRKKREQKRLMRWKTKSMSIYRVKASPFINRPVFH